MASISVNTFEFSINVGTSGMTRMTTKTGRRYYVNVQSGRAWKALPMVGGGVNRDLKLPRKMAAAMILACVKFDRDNQHLKKIWRPRW